MSSESYWVTYGKLPKTRVWCTQYLDRMKRGGLLLLYIFVNWNWCFHFIVYLCFVPKLGVKLFLLISLRSTCTRLY